MSSIYTFTVSELTEYIKSIIGNKKIRISGEVSQPVIRGGHLYFSLKDETSNIKSIVWKSKNINKELIIEGSKIIMDCKLDYYGGSGNVNLIVEKIITHNGEGELFIKYEKIKQEFSEKGYFDLTRKKKLPNIIKNILIITSNEGAALQDFIYNLNNNKSLLNYDIEDVKVQGIECPKNICDLLLNLKKINKIYDIVVITRGGGSFSDLFGFSQPELIESVYNFHLPVLSAIGHQVDNPLLDLVADITKPTPSLAAQFIIEHNKNYLNSLILKFNNLKNDFMYDLNNQLNILNNLDKKLNKHINNIKLDCQTYLSNYLNNKLNKLNIFETKLNLKLNPSIELYINNLKINNIDELNNNINQVLKLKWYDKEYKIKIL